MTGHTSGPWEATANEVDEMLGEWTVRDSEGLYICEVKNPYASYGMATKYAQSPDCQMEPNARLIAAAPELLESLTYLLRHVSDERMSEADIARHHNAIFAKAVMHARAAISKATT